MATGKNKRKRRKKKGTKIKGILMRIDGQLQPVTFDVPCSFCGQLMKSLPIRIPKPGNWKWIDDGQISYDVFYCCTQQACVESGTNAFREALTKGIEVEGEPPQDLFPKDQEE